MNDIVHHHPEAQADKNHVVPWITSRCHCLLCRLRALHCCTVAVCAASCSKQKYGLRLSERWGRDPTKQVSRLTALRSRLFQDRSNATPVFPLSTTRRQEATVVQVHSPPAGYVFVPHAVSCLTGDYAFSWNPREEATSLFGVFKKSKAAVKSRAVEGPFFSLQMHSERAPGSFCAVQIRKVKMLLHQWSLIAVIFASPKSKPYMACAPLCLHVCSLSLSLSLSCV